MKIKKKIWMIAVALTLFTVLFAIGASAEMVSGTNGGMDWSLDTSTGELTISGSGAMTSVWNVSDYNGSVTKIIVEEGVTSLPAKAFDSLTQGFTVLLPSSLEKTNTAFNGSKVTAVTFAEEGKLGIVNAWAFSGCSLLESIVLPNNAETTIQNGAFNNCGALTSVTLGNKTTSIFGNAFNNCSALTEIVIPVSVASLGDASNGSAFNGCSALAKVTFLGMDTQILPATASAIPTNAVLHGFKNSTADSYANTYDRSFVELVMTIGGTCGANLKWELSSDGELIISGTGAMNDYSSTTAPWKDYNDKITKVTVGEGVTSLWSTNKSQPFNGLTGDFTISLPSTLTKIDRDFNGCANLTAVTFAKEGVLEKIDGWAFANCKKLVSVTLPDNVATKLYDGSFNNCTSLVSVTLGNKTTQLIGRVFNNCSALIEIIIPASVTQVGNSTSGQGSAFNGCSALAKVTFLGTDTEILPEDANGIPSSATIYGFKGSTAETYANTYERTFVDLEQTSNYLAYQTTVIEKKTVDNVEKRVFDLRMLAGVDSLEYNFTGYHVTVIYQKGGETYESMRELRTRTVYDSIKEGNKWTPATELGAKYLVAIAIGDIDADCDRIELVIKPYTSKDGLKNYGDAAILVWTGATDVEGYPVFEYSDQYIEYTLDVTTDTNIKFNDTGNYNNEELIQLKTSGGATRHAYFRFDLSNLSESELSSLKASSEISFEFYVSSTRTLTSEESAAGGILCDVYLVNDDWDETTLTGATVSSQITSEEKIGQMRYTKGRYCSIDVTEYVLACLEDDKKVSFKLQNVENDGATSPAKIYSLESAQNVPRLVVQQNEYEHEINLEKLNNTGYEPWGYAEKLVDAWIAEGRDALYTHEPYDTIDLAETDISVSNGAHTVAFNKYGQSPSSSSSVIYARKVSTLENFSNETVQEYDKYGGITNSGITGEATGYFHTETHGNRTYIIDPLGNPFFAVGVNTVQLGANQNQKDYALEKYETEDNFYKTVSDEMKAKGINTFWGGDDGFLENGLVKATELGCMWGYMGNELGLSVSTGGSAKYKHNNTMNVFDPDFAAFCNTKVGTVADKYLRGSHAEYKDQILGFYSDNELPGQKDMLACYLTIDSSDPVNAFSYATAWTFLVKRTGNPNPSLDDVTDELSEEFKAFVYDTYFSCVTNALEAAGAGDYMYLGNRIHSTNMTSEGYLRAASKYLDIVSVNLYDGIEPSIETIKTIYKYSGKPMIVTEFFSKANDAKDANGYSLGNQYNGGIIVDTQADRATMYENYTLLLIESQTCVGWTWYRFRDNDQTIYHDADGVPYRAYDYQNGGISAYYNLNTNEKVALADAPALTVYYQGETDTSNLGSNKGIYDNHMNLYTELAGAITNISSNILGIIDYFNTIHE